MDLSLLCAYCVSAGYTTAAFIVAREPNRTITVTQVGSHWANFLRKVHAGQDPDFPPDTLFSINHGSLTDCKAVTMFGGTAVCPSCLPFVIDDARTGRSVWRNA